MDWKTAPAFTTSNRNPGKCSNCNLPLRRRNGEQEAAILTGIQIDFEGDLEFCQTCVGKAAVMLGYVSPEAILEVKAENDELTAANAQLVTKVSQQSDSIRALMIELSQALDDAEPVDA